MRRDFAFDSGVIGDFDFMGSTRSKRIPDPPEAAEIEDMNRR